jgi:hypothetical protein
MDKQPEHLLVSWLSHTCVVLGGELCCTILSDVVWRNDCQHLVWVVWSTG